MASSRFHWTTISKGVLQLCKNNEIIVNSQLPIGNNFVPLQATFYDYQDTKQRIRQ